MLTTSKFCVAKGFWKKKKKRRRELEGEKTNKYFCNFLWVKLTNPIFQSLEINIVLEINFFGIKGLNAAVQ